VAYGPTNAAGGLSETGPVAGTADRRPSCFLVEGRRADHRNPRDGARLFLLASFGGGGAPRRACEGNVGSDLFQRLFPPRQIRGSAMASAIDAVDIGFTSTRGGAGIYSGFQPTAQQRRGGLSVLAETGLADSSPWLPIRFCPLSPRCVGTLPLSVTPPLKRSSRSGGMAPSRFAAGFSYQRPSGLVSMDRYMSFWC